MVFENQHPSESRFAGYKKSSAKRTRVAQLTLGRPEAIKKAQGKRGGLPRFCCAISRIRRALWQIQA